MKGLAFLLGIALAGLFFGPALSAEPEPTFLLATSQKISTRYGNRVWPGFSQTAFPILLLNGNNERFFCPDNAPQGFQSDGYDTGTQCPVYTRNDSVFPVSMKATFPFAGSGPVIVIGTPAFTDSNPAAWIATIIHEHFHQYQMQWPGYFTALKALDLQGDDDTGMWALTYPFSYQNPKMGDALARLSAELITILEEPDPELARQLALRYAQRRPSILQSLTDPDRRYLEFQLWQEGIARYTEIVMTEHVASGPSGDFGHHDYAALATHLNQRVIDTLREADLARHQRVYFYSLGAAEALVLDRINAHWHDHYFESNLTLAPFFAGASPLR